MGGLLAQRRDEEGIPGSCIGRNISHNGREARAICADPAQEGWCRADGPIIVRNILSTTDKHWGIECRSA